MSADLVLAAAAAQAEPYRREAEAALPAHVRYVLAPGPVTALRCVFDPAYSFDSLEAALQARRCDYLGVWQIAVSEAA